MTPPFVRFRNVRLRRNAWGGLRDFSLDVSRGEFVTLLGPAGSGATAALMLLAGFCEAKGEVALNGRLLARTPPHRRGIGAVFAADPPLPARSVAEAIGFPLLARGVRRRGRRARVAEMLAAVDLGESAARRPEALPPVQRRRCLLGRALVFGPRLLLLDGFFRGLAAEERAGLAATLRRLHVALGLTVVQACVDPAEALALSDRVAILEDGALVQAGTPDVLYEAPASAAAACALGEVNRLPGVLVGTDEDVSDVRLDCGPVVQAVLQQETAPGAGVEVVAPGARVEVVASGARVEVVAPGARVEVVVRPERVAVAAIPADEMGGHAIPAVLREIRHCGDHLRLALRLGEAGEIVVRRPAIAGLAGLAPGAPVSLAWQPGHARAFGETA